MASSPVVAAHGHLTAAVDELSAASTPIATADDLLSVLTIGEGVARRLDQIVVAVVADLLRRGTFAERGYRNAVTAVADLMGWDRAEARRRVNAAEQVCPRTGLDGAVLPAKLPATAQQFTTGAAGLRHVEAIVRVLASPSAKRLSPAVWSGAEAQLAAHADRYTPSELLEWGSRLVDTLDQDGPEPDDRPFEPVNEVQLQRFRGRPGGTLKGHFDDAAMFDAIAAVVDAQARPTDADDQRTQAQRQAAALADACGYVLDHGDVPACGGRRPHLNVLVRLEDLEHRARAACLDFGGTLSPESLRMLCCDAAVVPIVLDGKGQPLDVGRATRAIPDGLRRAIAARDGGCARCGRPSSWCEVHHVVPWEQGGKTSLANCVMVCRACHRLIHHAGWDVLLTDGRPEFYPPSWIDPQRRARRRPPHFSDAVRTTDHIERPAGGRAVRRLVNSSCATGSSSRPPGDMPSPPRPVQRCDPVPSPHDLVSDGAALNARTQAQFATLAAAISSTPSCPGLPITDSRVVVEAELRADGEVQLRHPDRST